MRVAGTGSVTVAPSSSIAVTTADAPCVVAVSTSASSAWAERRSGITAARGWQPPQAP